MAERIVEILSQEHIQDVGRELWQSHYDNDDLDSLPDSVMETVSTELWEELDPKKHPTESIAEAFVEEYLDIGELNQEAEDNTEYIREVQEARRGQY